MKETYLTEILIKLTKALAGTKLDMVRSNYTATGIDVVVCDNETKQIALFSITPIPEPEKPWAEYGPEPIDMGDHDCHASPNDGCACHPGIDDGYGHDCA